MLPPNRDFFSGHSLLIAPAQTTKGRSPLRIGGQIAAFTVNEHSGFLVLTIFFLATLLASPVRAGNISFPPQAIQAMDKIYAGDTDAAIAFAHTLERAQPDHPFGYLLEDQARWWKMYCDEPISVIVTFTIP